MNRHHSPWSACVWYAGHLHRNGIEIRIGCLLGGDVMSTGGFSVPKTDERLGEEAAMVLRIKRAFRECLSGGYCTDDELRALMVGAAIQERSDRMNAEWNAAETARDVVALNPRTTRKREKLHNFKNLTAVENNRIKEALRIVAKIKTTLEWVE